MKVKILHLYSGGLDSHVLLHDMIAMGHSIECVGFHYGQTHFKEIDFARRNCSTLGIPYHVSELSNVFGKSALVGGVGGVVVPNRNACLLHIAAAKAEAKGFNEVTFGATKEDFDGFPDCRPDFVRSINLSLELAGLTVRVVAPYSLISKRDIVNIGRRLNVDFDSTWSCYVGGNEPCGKCLACKKRIESLK